VKIRGILLDKDGTLLDYWKTWVPINRSIAMFAAGGNTRLAGELLRAGGHDPETDRLTPGTVLAAGSVDEIAEVFAGVLKERTPPRLTMHIERLFREGGAKYSVLIDGVADVVRHLNARGLKLGVATNDSIGGLEASLAPHGLLGEFLFVAGCDSGYGAKPEPGMALAFCEATGLRPRDVAIVGDTVHDLEMGRRAGLGLKVGVTTGTSPREDLALHADVVLKGLGELLGIERLQPAATLGACRCPSP
jgi:phosphoglycolate phosphatase